MLNRRNGWFVAIVLVGVGGALGAGARVWSERVTPETIAAGKALFEHEWIVNDPLAQGDGLGPVFNARSCVECHFQGGVGGGGPNRHNVSTFEVVPVGDRRHVASGVVHKFALNELFREAPQRVRELFPIVPGGQKLLNGCLVQTQDFDPVLFSEASTPPLFGLGLIDRIPDIAIQAAGARRTFDVISKELDGERTGTSVGRVRSVSGGLGKFGWKGQFATLEDFVAAACAVELGLGNPLRPQDTPRQHRPDASARPDMTRRQLRELVAFVANLPAPREIVPVDPHARRQAEHGKALFATIGCADCHTPNLGGVEGVYSDFRLYRLETSSANDSYARVETEFEMPRNHPQPNEWKTPPLWGVADSAPYFHDGASLTLEAAILRHDVAARHSRSKYKSLTSEDQQALLAFLGTLRAPQIERERPLVSAL